MNSGKAAICQLAALSQVLPASTLPIGTDVVSTMAIRPTIPRPIAIHTPLARITQRAIRRRIESVGRSSAANID